MKSYRVGGCVRDRLLGFEVKDVDWVVTGATEQQMLALGYQPIGRDFPVFLHPESKQEYALARSERKTGPGYRGFAVDADPATTIEQDLLRRDLTINAMAEDEAGNLVDPYGGREDIERRQLRHVSAAFVEDPVRVLRVARFAARYHHLGFTIAAETRELIRQIGDSGELEALVAERVWSELTRALDEPDPQIFFLSLRDCGVLARLFPEIGALFGVAQSQSEYREPDAGMQLLSVLAASAALGYDNETRFALLMHDLGKAATPGTRLPDHHEHEQLGKPLVEKFCRRWRAPRAYTELALITTELHPQVHRAFELQPASLLQLITRADALRKPERFGQFLDACLADWRGRSGRAGDEYPQAPFLLNLAAQLHALDVSRLRQQGFEGEALAREIRQARIELIAQQQALAQD